MKPLHVVITGALLAVVAVVVLFLMNRGDGRYEDRRGGERSATSSATPEDGAGGVTAGDGRRHTGPGGGTLAVTLKVVLPDGSPAGGAAIQILGAGTYDGAADPEGHARIAGLLPGLYNLIARQGEATGSLGFELTKTTDLGVLTLKESVALRGKVLDGATGQPIAGADVEAVVDDSAGFSMTTFVKLIGSPEQVAARTQTDAEGAYEMRVPAHGRFALRALARGYAQEGEPSRTYTSDTNGLDFHLFPGLLLAGHVVDPRGAPVPGARVMFLDPLSALGRRIPKVEAITDFDGAFSMSATPRDNAMLIVRATGYATYMQQDPQLPSPDVTISLEPGISIRLRTVDAEDPERPAPHVNVVMVYHGGFGAGETDDNGLLVIPNLPTEGTGRWGGQQQAFLWGGDFIGRQLQLPPDEPRNGELDLGGIKMTRGGIVRGKVLDAVTREGIGGARIRAMGGAMDETMLLNTGVITEADGSFELRGVHLAATALAADHAGYVSSLDPVAFLQGMQRGGGKRLFPEGVHEIEKDVELTPALHAFGTVLAPDGSPVAGAQVEVRNEMSMVVSMLGGPPRSAMSGGDGRFDLGGFRKGEEVPVLATHRDWGPSAPVSVKAGDTAVELRLTEPLRIEGTVVDEKDAPIPGVRVTVDRADNPSGGSRMVGGMEDPGAARPAITDATGHYLVRNAPPGELVVQFESQDYMPEKVDIALAAGTKTKQMGKTTLKRGFGIEGVAVDEAGKPRAGVMVSASLSGMAQPAGSGRLNGNTRADEKGHFAIYGLRDGSYELRTWEQGFYAERLVVPTGTTDARLVLRQGGTLLGRVTGGGLPVAGASVRAQIVSPDGQQSQFVGWGRTDDAGVFRIQSVPPLAPFTVTITHDSYKELKVENVRASDRQQDFVMDPGLRVAGIVVDPDGDPVAGAQLYISVPGGFNKRVTAGVDGHFEAGGLAEGTYQITVQESGLNLIRGQSVQVTAGDHSLRIVVQRGESISGMVVDAEGQGVSGLRLEALDASGNVVASTWVWDDAGSFQLRGVPRGTYTLRATTGGVAVAGEQPPPQRTGQVTGVATGSTGVKIEVR